MAATGSSSSSTPATAGSAELVRSLSTAVIELDERLAVCFMNPSAETLLGLSQRQAYGQLLVELLDPSAELVGLCRRVLATGVTVGLREYQTAVALRELVLDCRAAPLQSSGGVLLELTDAAFERKIRQESGLLAQQRLSRRIVRQLAHEVKNPLGGMRGAAQLLERQLPGEELKQYTRVIIAEADRLAALVDSILMAGGEARPSRVNVHEITEQVARLLEVEKPHDVTLVRDYDPSLPEFAVDKNQLIQALLNIARNAMQALGEEGTLVLRTRAQPNATIGGDFYRLVLVIEVQDDGPGIPDELRETVFYPLVTGRTSGTGLGLTIAQDLVSRNNGLVEFDSKPGCTIFQLRLPAER
jgi:two-component system nitrogen regulation sensor histidine kinase GlnL